MAEAVAARRVPAARRWPRAERLMRVREEDEGGDVRRGVGSGRGSGAGAAAGPGRRFDGTWESLRTHQVPVWFDDAKLGIFIHWGLYSVPGWAPRVPDIQQLLVKDGPKRMLRNTVMTAVQFCLYAALTCRERHFARIS